MPPPSFIARPTFFYPQLVYGPLVPLGTPVTINFVNPATALEPTELAIRGENVSLTGLHEILYIRTEVRIRLLFELLSSAEISSLRTYWEDWGRHGRQAFLTLDRLNTAMGQFEYDEYNTYFSRAELVTNPFEPRRRILNNTIYRWDLMFRQGSVEAT